MYRDDEKARYAELKPQLFTANAQGCGNYRGQPRPFCLADDCSEENLHESIRRDAIQYAKKRGIPWHDGQGGCPSNHLCCSQSFCFNTWFPFIDRPTDLAAVLQGLGYDATEMLQVTLDDPLEDGQQPYVAFEWIGRDNYLHERCRSRTRTRGQHFTSADFAFRFRRSDGRVQIVLGEWKYTEEYGSKGCMRYSNNGTDRYQIYEAALNSPHCQIQWKTKLSDPLPIFYDPFDQLMRLQLLASEMEHAGEMEADVVSVLHVAPEANTDLMNVIASPMLRDLGMNNIHDLWGEITAAERFKGIHTEVLLPIVTRQLAGSPWADWMQLRYGR